jgi:MarR family transcriptional regulator, lower aerobic nicotinate degradation pathway regulator
MGSEKSTHVCALVAMQQKRYRASFSARIRPGEETFDVRFDKTPYHQTPGFLIRRLHQVHVAIFLQECAAFDITPVQFSLLKALSGGEEMDQATIATQIGVDRTTTAGVLRRLHARRLVKWRNAPQDRRAKFWRRTLTGDRLVKKMAAHASRSHERLVASLTQSQLRSCIDVLRRLVDANNELGRAPLHLK